MKTSSALETLVVPRMKGLRESALWIFAGFAIVLLAALMSFDPGDPAFSVVGEQPSVSNRMGPAGAYFADVAFLLLGYS
jgi:S-DNA-T family DNA segregation ATPase FtsK/SpoIIIE